jgi:thiamine kinase-like enzyme
MTPAVYQEALDAYGNPFHEFTVEQLHGGLINQSYKVTSKKNGGSFLLQQINHKVFTNPEHVQLNYEMLWKHLQAEQIHFRIPEPKYFIDNTTFYCDKHDNFWRVSEFMDDTEYLTAAENIAQARTVAETFAGFTACFESFDPEQLHITIPRFHNLSFRFNQFKDSLHSGNYERLAKATSLIQELKQRERYANFYDVITESIEFPLRVMHHDAKIANILFDEETGEVICPVDFDTTMPGYFFSDLGDMIRSMACSKDENSTDFDDLCIREDFYKAIMDGYLSVMGEQLTSSEKKYIHYAGIIMFYMQALRFLADYLNGDVYYRIEYPEQNFDRAKNQLILLQKLEEFLRLNYQFKV